MQIWSKVMRLDKVLFRRLEIFVQLGLRVLFPRFILPFYPWTSMMASQLWTIVRCPRTMEQGRYQQIEEDFDLMFDLVLNHCSTKSPWFKEYVSGVEPD